MVEWLSQRVMHRPFVNEGAGVSNGITWKEQDERDAILKAREDTARVKVCTKCNLWKPFSEYYKTKGGKYGLHSLCKSCDNERHREWYEKNKIEANAYRGRSQRSLKQKCVAYKGGKCSTCGYNKCVAALDFHHINPKEKEFAFHGLTASWKKAQKELNKCVLLCANCHRELHYNSKEQQNRTSEKK